MVPAVTATGVLKFACCHPEADSPEKVTVASRVPVELQRLPVWVPVLPATL